MERKNPFLQWFGALAIVAWFAACPARAELATLTLNGPGPTAGTMTVNFGASTDANYNGTNEGVWSGPYLLQVNNGSPFLGYCVGFSEFINQGDSYQVNVTKTGISGLQTGWGIGWLVANNQPTNVIESKGLSLALWKLATDGGGAFNMGSIEFDPASESDGQAVLNAANLYVTEGLAHNTSATGQSVADFAPTGYGQEMAAAIVPEPASMTLFGIGLTGLIGCTWRRRTCRCRAPTLPIGC